MRRNCGARAPDATSSFGAAGRAAATAAPARTPPPRPCCGRRTRTAAPGTAGWHRPAPPPAAPCARTALRRCALPGPAAAPGRLAGERPCRRPRLPRAGNQNSRSPSTASAPGNQAEAGARFRSRSASRRRLSGDRASLTGPAPDLPSPRVRAAATRLRSKLFERLHAQPRGILQRRRARGPRDLFPMRAVRQQTRPAPRATARSPAAAPPPPAPSARPAAAGTCAMGLTGSRYGTPILASGMPPTSLAITGTPRSMASTTMRERASAHSDGTSSTRVRASSSSISSTGVEQRHVGPRPQRRAVPLVGAPHRHGRERRLRKGVRQRQKNVDPLHRARVHHA